MPYTIDTIRNMPQDQLDLIGFQLSSKVTWKILKPAFQLARTDTQVAEASGIDGLNDHLAKLAQMEAENEFFETTGLGDSTADPRKEIASWLAVRQILVERGVKVQPFVENFKFLINRAATDMPTEADMERLAELSGISKDEVEKTYKMKAGRNAGRTIRDCEGAMEVINSIAPDDTHDPADLDEVVNEAIAASKKSAIIMANSVEDAMANAIFLKAMEEGVA